MGQFFKRTPVINKLKSLESTFSVNKAAIIVGFFTLLSRLTGLLRDRLFASKFGAGDILDAYYTAFRIPDFVFNLLILGTLSVAFIPVFSELLVKDREQANRTANTILNSTFLLIFSICAILWIFSGGLSKALVPGFTGEKLANSRSRNSPVSLESSVKKPTIMAALLTEKVDSRLFSLLITGVR